MQRLVDLVNSNYEMSSEDKDYKLSHEQLIKVCKILLHMNNSLHSRINQEMESLD